MSNDQIIALIKGKIGILVLGGLLVSAVSFLFLGMTEKNFKANTDFLVIQEQSGTQDYYSLSKSAEYISKILSESVYSELFIDEVIATGKVNKEFLPFDKKNKLEEWSKIVAVKRNVQLGVISIETFDNSQKNVLNISLGIAEVITTKNNLFRGDSQNINVKILSGPVIEKNPGINKIVMVVLGGFVLGFFLTLIGVYYREEARRNKNTRNEDEHKDSLEYLDA